MIERVYVFNWDIIGNLLKGRPHLGDHVNLALYRLMYYSLHKVVVKKIGNAESNQLFHDAGNIAGRFFFDHFLREYKDLPLDDFSEKVRSILVEQGIQFLRIDSVSIETGECAVSVTSAIGGPHSGSIQLDSCNYDVGFAEGILSKYAEKPFKTTMVETHDVQDILPKQWELISLVPYRMLQYTVRDVTEQAIGTEACNQLFYDAGVMAGHFFFDNFLAKSKQLSLNEFVGELQSILKVLGVGVLRVEKADLDAGEFILTVSEDLDCSGLPNLGLKVCNYDEGFIASIFHKYTGDSYQAKEVSCWCSGDRTCRFLVNRTA